MLYYNVTNILEKFSNILYGKLFWFIISPKVQKGELRPNESQIPRSKQRGILADLFQGAGHLTTRQSQNIHASMTALLAASRE